MSYNHDHDRHQQDYIMDLLSSSMIWFLIILTWFRTNSIVNHIGIAFAEQQQQQQQLFLLLLTWLELRTKSTLTNSNISGQGIKLMELMTDQGADTD